MYILRALFCFKIRPFSLCYSRRRNLCEKTCGSEFHCHLSFKLFQFVDDFCEQWPQKQKPNITVTTTSGCNRSIEAYKIIYHKKIPLYGLGFVNHNNNEALPFIANSSFKQNNNKKQKTNLLKWNMKYYHDDYQTIQSLCAHPKFNIFGYFLRGKV